MYDVTIIIPIFNLTGERRENFIFILSKMESVNINCQVIISEQFSDNIMMDIPAEFTHNVVYNDSGVINKSKLINEAVALANTKYIWEIDSDVLLKWQEILPKIKDQDVIHPFKTIVKLKQQETKNYLKQSKIVFDKVTDNVTKFGPLTFIVKKEIYQKIQGMDESYEGWGWEDYDIAERLKANYRIEQFDDIGIHLWHPPASESNESTNRKIYEDKLNIQKYMSQPAPVTEISKTIVTVYSPTLKTPTVIFAYNRPNHLKNLLYSIPNDDIVGRDFIFYLDKGGKHEEEVKKVIIEWKGPYKTKSCNVSTKNLGLKNSVINGITKTLLYTDKVIVLEDDLILEPNFFKYMEICLEKYKSDSRVWHVSGYSRGVEYPEDEDIYFHQRPETWGYGLWKNRWNSFKEDIDYYDEIKNNSEEKARFCGHGSFLDWELITRAYNKDTTLDTWGMWWYLTIFKHKGLCVNPKYSLVKNSGFGEDSTNCNGAKPFGENIKAYFNPSRLIDPYINMNAYASRAKTEIAAYGGLDTKRCDSLGNCFSYF